MKIPKQAKKVHEWKIFSTYQWKQKLYDGTFTTFEMVKRSYCADVIATIDNKILILKQSQPGRNNFFWLPGGRVEQWEPILRAAKRELLEETGCTSKNWQKFKSWNEASKIDFEETTFVARNCEMIKFPNLDAGEKISMFLVDFDEFLDIMKQENCVVSVGFKFFVYECLLDKKLKSDFKKFIFGKG